MNDTQALLDSLRDVIEPAPPPSTSVWWVLANLALLLIIVVIAIYYVRRRRNQWRTMALHNISRARTETPAKSLLKLAKLLRQIMLHRGNNTSKAAGEYWLNLLDKEFNTQWFSQGNGSVFGDALYKPAHYTEEQRDHWCHTIETLVRQLPAATSDKITHTKNTVLTDTRVASAGQKNT